MTTGRTGVGVSIKSHLVGHPIYWDTEKQAWLYADDDSVASTREPEVRRNLRPCPVCGLNPADYDGHDPCIANLPGVEFACCGHGVGSGYVKFEDGRIIKGYFDDGKS